MQRSNKRDVCRLEMRTPCKRNNGGIFCRNSRQRKGGAIPKLPQTHNFPYTKLLTIIKQENERIRIL